MARLKHPVPARKEKRIRYANEELLAGNLDVIAEVFSNDYVAHGDRDNRGHQFLRRFAKQPRTALTNIKIEEITALTKAGVTIVWRHKLSGKHEADLRGIPPSGRKVKWTDMVVSRF